MIKAIATGEVSLSTRVARETVAAVKADAHPVALLPARDFCAEGVDDSGNFMPGDSREFDPWKAIFLDMQIAGTDSAGINANADTAKILAEARA